ncbi:MAG: HD domain-containing protein [Nitrospirae bacterium]|nr:HD domain-containing protein [Nitrospirota bacterium]
MTDMREKLSPVDPTIGTPPEVLAERRDRTSGLFAESERRLAEYLRALHGGSAVSPSPLSGLVAVVTEELFGGRDQALEKVFYFSERAADPSLRTARHSLNVAVLSCALGAELEFRPERLRIAVGCALVHDVGVLSLPPDLVERPRPLSAEEFGKLREHCGITRDLLARRGGDEAALAQLVYQAQERYDGSGYPLHLAGEDLDDVALVLGFCDTIEGLTHDRPQRTARTFMQAVELLLSEARDRFPEYMWIAALGAFTLYPPGSIVTLSSGRVARVLRTHSEAPMRPVVEILGDRTSRQPQLADLRHLPFVHITGQVSAPPRGVLPPRPEDAPSATASSIGSAG